MFDPKPGVPPSPKWHTCDCGVDTLSPEGICPSCCIKEAFKRFNQEVMASLDKFAERLR